MCMYEPTNKWQVTLTYVPLLDLIRQAAIDRKGKIVPPTDVTQNHHHGALHGEQKVVQILSSLLRVCAIRTVHIAWWVFQQQYFAVKGTTIGDSVGRLCARYPSELAVFTDCARNIFVSLGVPTALDTSIVRAACVTAGLGLQTKRWIATLYCKSLQSLTLREY